MGTARPLWQPPDSESPSERFDRIISKVRDSTEPGAALLIEHLETAHAYFLGAMPEECMINLDLARQAAATLADRPLQRETEKTLDLLLADVHRPVRRSSTHLAGHNSWRSPELEPAPTAAGLEEFFHGADSTLGVFYPVQHVVAVFPSWERALAGQRVLRGAGLRAGDVLAVPGPELALFLADRRAKSGLLAHLVTEVSRFLDTEAVLVEHYSQWGRQGSGFLIAYAPTEASMNELPQLLKPLRPTAVHGFLSGSIRHLIGRP